MSVDAAVAAMEGAAALPRANGELVFDIRGRAVRSASVSLYRGGAYDWDRFRGRLVAEIGDAEPDDGAGYYDRWLSALERVLLEEGVVTEDELAARAVELGRARRARARPPPLRGAAP